MPPTNFVLTGSTGFLGSRVLEALLENYPGSNIIAAGRRIKPFASFDSPRVLYRLGDLGERNYVSSLFSEIPIHYVINCAALSSPWGKYEDFYHANVRSQKFLIEESTSRGIERYVHISTPSVYFDFKDRLGVKESDALPSNMPNFYAQTKLAADELLQESKLSWIALRPRALIGRGDTVIMPRVIRAVDEGRLRIIGGGTNRVDLTPVANVVHAVLLSLSAPENASREVYNISNGAPVELWPLLSEAITRMGRKAPDRKVPLGLVMTVAGLMEFFSKWFQANKEPTLTRYGVGTLAYNFSLDISKARERLGYIPRQSVGEALDEFLDWYQRLNHEN